MLQNIPVKKKILSQQWQYQSVTSASITSASVIAVLMVGSDDIISDSLSPIISLLSDYVHRCPVQM